MTEIFDPITAELPAPAKWYWRLPIIRHVRAINAVWKMDRHYRFWRTLGYLPINRPYDLRCIRAIWKGKL